MTPLLAFTFLEVIWWMVIVFFWSMFIWMFISIFADVFRRDDISGMGKAGWILLFVFLPFIGILIYIIMRPKVTASDIELMARVQAGGPSAATEIETAKRLHDAGTINDEEFQQLKQKALR